MTTITSTTTAAKAIAIPTTNQNAPMARKSVGAGMLVEDRNGLDNVGSIPRNKGNSKHLFHESLRLNYAHVQTRSRVVHFVPLFSLPCPLLLQRLCKLHLLNLLLVL